MPRRPPRTNFALLAVALVASAAVFAAGCGGGGGKGSGTPSTGSTVSAPTASADEAAIVAAIETFFNDYNDKDVEGVLAVLTDELLQQQLGVTRETAAETLASYLGDPPQELTGIANIQITGDTASADASFKQSGVLLSEQHSLVRQNGVWMFTDFIAIETPIPEGMLTLPLTLTEYKYDVDISRIPNESGFAFAITNAGQAEHEVDLNRVPQDFDLAQYVETQELPQGVVIDDIMYLGPLDPGDESALVFPDGLPSGRYVILSLATDDEGTTDAQHGMTLQFTIE